MGDIKVFNDASLQDTEGTVTSSNNQVSRISTVIDNLDSLITAVESNTQAVQSMTQGASPELDTFREIEDNLDINDFIAALNGQ